MKSHGGKEMEKLNKLRKIVRAYNKKLPPDANVKAVIMYENAGCPAAYVMATESGAIVRVLSY